MRLDAQLAFVPVGAPLSLVAAAGVAVPSNIIDLMGSGVGTPIPNTFGAGDPSALWGADLGVGDHRLLIAMATGAAFTANAGTPTLNVQFQGAPDLGTPTYQPGAWQTFMETGPITVAQLGAGVVIGQFDWAAAFPVTEAGARPRFVRINFSVLAATSFATGTIAYAVPTTARDDWRAKFQNRNYTVA
jgi:hypothetical protein